MGAQNYTLDDFSKVDRVQEYVEALNLEACFSGGAGDLGIAQPEPEQTQNRLHAVDPENFKPFSPDWAKLARLHWLTRARGAV